MKVANLYILLASKFCKIAVASFSKKKKLFSIYKNKRIDCSKSLNQVVNFRYCRYFLYIKTPLHCQLNIKIYSCVNYLKIEKTDNRIFFMVFIKTELNHCLVQDNWWFAKFFKLETRRICKKRMQKNRTRISDLNLQLSCLIMFTKIPAK